MVKITFVALIVLCVVCLMLFATTTLTNGGQVYKTFATHPDTPPSGGLLLWAKTDGTFQTTNSSGTDAGMGGASSGGAGPIVSANNSAALADFASGVEAVITFNHNEYDTSAGAMHSESTNTSRFVAPTTGYYFASCGMILSTGGTFFVRLKRNGIQIGAGAGAGTGPTYMIAQASNIAQMTAGQYVECFLQPSGVDHPSGEIFQFLKVF